ncbi:MAG: WYL domain-containing protein [Patescibacteria group bacterium]
MNNEELLKTAIQERRFVNFHYEDKPIRKAAPHAIYYSTADHLNLDVFQYGGYSKTGSLPDWRNFTLDKIRNVELLDENFEIANGYKPSSSKYSRYVCKA